MRHKRRTVPDPLLLHDIDCQNRYDSEIYVVDSGFSKRQFLLRNTLQRIISELFAGIISLDLAEFFAGYNLAIHGLCHLAVFAGRLYIVAEQFLLCHNGIPPQKSYQEPQLYFYADYISDIIISRFFKNVYRSKRNKTTNFPLCFVDFH